jgi:hypothetical protein
VANPCNKELALEFGGVHVSTFANQVELSFLDCVDQIRHGKVVLNMFILHSELFDMVHVGSDDLANGGVAGGRHLPSEFNSEGPRFGTTEGHVCGKGQEAR